MNANSESTSGFASPAWLRTLFLIPLLFALSALAGATSPDSVQRERLARMQVPFVENCGQLDDRVAFSAPTFSGGVFITREGQIVYSLPKDGAAGWTLTETLDSGKPTPFAGSRAVTRVSYFHGKDATRWQSGLPTYDEVHLGDVWRGISVSLRAQGDNVEKVFTVGPGARVEKIRLLLEGTTSLRIDGDGALLAETGDGEVRFTAPVAYQEVDGVRRPVSAAYVLHGNRYGFRLGRYDHALPVIVDPLLQSTYLGGSAYEAVSGIAIDPTSGDVLVAGYTGSADFPGTTGGAQASFGGFGDAFVGRLDAALTTLVQATYLGGTDGDAAYGIAIHPTSGEVLVTGITYSADFPGTVGGAQSVFGGVVDGFIARLDMALNTLLQATYLGSGDVDYSQGIAIDPASGEVFVAGFTNSADFPGTAGGAQPTSGGGYDAFVARFDATLTSLLQSTYLGGSGDGDEAQAIAFDSTSGEVLVAGFTPSTDFPGTAGGAQPAVGGGSVDGFIARLNPTLTALLQATYLGGSGNDFVYGIAIQPTGNEVLVVGPTDSTDFPATSGGAQAVPGGDLDGFVAQLNPSLTALLQATYLGGPDADALYGIAIHPTSGEVFVAGATASREFPEALNGDAVVARLDATLTALRWVITLGGSSADSVSAIAIHPTSGQVVVAGHTYSTDFPGTAGGAQPAFGGGEFDAFVARLSPDLGGLTVSIDIKPGSDTNPINPKSKGKIPVAILTTDTFDATTVDATTVRFGAAGTEAGPTQFAADDVNGDRRPDLLLHFDTQKTGILCGDVSASLTGETVGGQAIQGSDSIVTVGCR